MSLVISKVVSFFHSRFIWIFIFNIILIIIPITGYYFIQSKNYQANRIRGVASVDLNRSLINLLMADYPFEVIKLMALPAPYQRFILIDSESEEIKDSGWLANINIIDAGYDFFLLNMASNLIDNIHEPKLEQADILMRLSPYISRRENRYSLMDYRINYMISHFQLEDGREVSLIGLIDKLDIQYTAKLWKIVLLFVSIISCLASIIISTLYYRIIIKPLLVLTREAELLLGYDVIPGNIFVMKDRRDEIGVLSKAFYDSTVELTRRKEAIETFSNDVLHELKNPLAAMMNGIEILHSLDDSGRHAEVLSILSRESGRIEKLLFDIREYSLFDHSSTCEQVSNPSTIIKEGLNIYPSSGIRLSVNACPELKISGDKLVCILTNLIDNALDFSPEYASVLIEVYREDGRSYLSVTDEGPGITNIEKKKIFNRFYSNRFGNENDESLHSGLGLSIVKRILDGYNYFISCEDHLPSGARFIICFDDGCDGLL